MAAEKKASHEALFRISLPRGSLDPTRFRSGQPLSRAGRACSISLASPESVYEIHFSVLKPKHLLGTFIASRLDCTPKAMWKLSWFLREFGYDPELLRRGEIDDQALVDLSGVLKVTRTIVCGVSIMQLDAFSSADTWEETATSRDQASAPSEVTS